MKCGRVESDLSAGALTATRSRLHARRPSPLAVTGTKAFPRNKNTPVAASPDASEREDAKRSPSRLAVTSVRRVGVPHDSETTPPPPPREARLGTPPPPPPLRPAGGAFDDARRSSAAPSAAALFAHTMSGVAGHPILARDRPAPRRLATGGGDARRVPGMDTSPSATSPPALPPIAGRAALVRSSVKRAPPRRAAPAAPVTGPAVSRMDASRSLKTHSRVSETVRSLRRRAEQTLAAMARARVSFSCASVSAVDVADARRVASRAPPRRPLASDPTATATNASFTSFSSTRGPGDRADARDRAESASFPKTRTRPKGDEAGGERPSANRVEPGPAAASPLTPPRTPGPSDASATRLDDRADRSRTDSSSEAHDTAPPERTPGDERETLKTSRDETSAASTPKTSTPSLPFSAFSSIKPTPPPPTRASDLPADALELTFAFLPPRALAFAGATCRAWREVASRESLWARLLAKRRMGDDAFFANETDASSWNVKNDVFSLESRWRLGKYARHDLHRHTWTVERVELVDTETHGRVVVTGGWDGQALAWRATRRNANDEDGEPLGVGNLWEPFRVFVGPGGAWVSALDATPSRVAAGDTNGRVFVWDYENAAPRRAWHHGGSVTTVRFAPTRGEHQKSETEKTFVASASTDGDAKVWCVATGGLIATLRGHADVCWHIKFIEALSDENAAFAVTAGRDGLAKTWRVPLRAAAAADDDAAPLCVSTLRAHDDAILAIAAWDPHPLSDFPVVRSPANGTHKTSLHSMTPLLATCGADDVVNVWRVEDGALLQTLRGHARGVLCATFCVWDFSLTLVTGSADATVRVWDVTSGSCSGVIEHHGAPVTQVIARADGMATVAPGDGVMAYWRLVDADEKCVEDAPVETERAGSASLPSGLRASMTLMDGAGSGFSACLAMDRKMLAVGTKTGTVHVLDFRRK